MQPGEFTQMIAARNSVRDFRPDPIAEETLAAILDDARYVPSWSNTRPYLLAIASGAQADRLRAAYLGAFDASADLRGGNKLLVAKSFITRRGLPDGDFKTWGKYPSDLNPRRVKVGAGLYRTLGIAREDKASRAAQDRRNFAFFDAPTVAFLFVHGGLMPFAAQDGGLMLQTLILAAHIRGVGSCPLGTLATWRYPVDEEFVIPPNYKLITGLALGYPTDSVINTFRADHPAVSLAESKK